jgi:hypothetical protein
MGGLFLSSDRQRKLLELFRSLGRTAKPGSPVTAPRSFVGCGGSLMHLQDEIAASGEVPLLQHGLVTVGFERPRDPFSPQAVERR